MLGRRKNQAGEARLSTRQSFRMRRFGIACLFPLGYLALVAMLYTLALLDKSALIHAVAIFCAGTAVFLLLFVNRMNLRSSDKSLTAEMTLAMIAAMLWILYKAPITQILFGPFVLLILMASAFRTQKKMLFVIAALVLVGSALAIYLHYWRLHNQALLKLELLHLSVLLATLAGVLWLGSRIRHLYRQLYRAGIQIESVEENARRDELTGCFNRRYLMMALDHEKQQADETDGYLCLAVIDLDHFKRINDEVGHLAGDDVLRAFANVAQQNVRDEDVFGRYGGEEFLLILPGIPLVDALNTVERIRAQTEEKLGLIAQLDRKVTVSIGITQYLAGETVLDLFSRADTAMYLAKTGGRNQVVVQELSHSRD